MLCIYVMTFIGGTRNASGALRWMQNTVGLTGGLWVHLFSNQQLVGGMHLGFEAKEKLKHIGNVSRRPNSQLTKIGPPDMGTDDAMRGAVSNVRSTTCQCVTSQGVTVTSQHFWDSARLHAYEDAVPG